jgi:mediator of RNA polymerase II transcription subunit 12
MEPSAAQQVSAVPSYPMLPFSSSLTGKQIRQRAEDALLSVMVTDSSPQQSGFLQKRGEISELDRLALIYLLIIEELGWTISDDEPPQLGGVIFERLNTLLQSIITSCINAPNRADGAKGASSLGQQPRLLFWLFILLRLTALHRLKSPATTATSKGDIVDQTRILLMVCCIALSGLFADRLDEQCKIFPDLSTPWSSHERNLPCTRKMMRTFTLDIAASLVDTLPDEARQSCIRVLRERSPPNFNPQNNPCLLHLFGPIAEPSPPPPTTQGVNVASPAPVYGASFSHSQAQTPPASAAQASSTLAPTTVVEDPTSVTHKLLFQQRGRILGPCPSRPWEMLEESAPILGINDTALNLAYFATRQVRG